MSNLLANLTDAQREAATHIFGPLLVVAGPGSGKTRTVTHRIAYMLEEGIPAHQILAITFTNKAAGEMRERVLEMVGEQRVLISTFHSMSARLLRKYSEAVGFTNTFTIYDTGDTKAMIKEIIKNLELDLSYFKPSQIRNMVSNFKNELRTPEMVDQDAMNFRDRNIANIYRRYQEELKVRNSMDFDDLLFNMLRVLRNDELRAELQNRFQYVMVDEYQDTNQAQYNIVKHLAEGHQNLCATGDPDQSIYGWRGANIKNILDFEEDFPNCRVVKLEQNYRSTKKILEAAERVIRHNSQRKIKALFTDNPDGSPVEVRLANTEKHESSLILEQVRHWLNMGIPASEIAVFYRVNSLSRNIEEYFRFHDVPYTIVGGVAFYERLEIKDILAYARLLINPWDSASFLRIVNTPRRAIGKTSIEAVRDFALSQNLDYFEATRRADEIQALKPRAQKSLVKFHSILEEIVAQKDLPVAEMLEHIVKTTDYTKHMEKVYNRREELQERMSNLEELLVAAQEFDNLNEEGSVAEFLERVALISDLDKWENQQEKVTLMTLHAAKGLEFQAVSIAGVEDGYLPHVLSKDTFDEIEEERRLFYVGITRAKEHLMVTHARMRSMWGKTEYKIPSPFLAEMLDESAMSY